MKLDTNLKRNFIIFILSLLHGIFISIPFYILFYVYKMPILLFIIISLSYIFFVAVEPFSSSNKIFKKYCNKECAHCSMWHCNFH